MSASTSITPPYHHTPLFSLGPDKTPYRKLSADGIRVEQVMKREMVMVPREAFAPNGGGPLFPVRR